MNRKIKTLGLALVAALALTAVMASVASAQFTSSSAHTNLSGGQTVAHKFTAGAGIGAINCTTATLAGTGEGTSQATLALTPTYNGCKDSLGRTVHVNAGNAEFELTSGADKGQFHIVGGSIVVTVTSGGGDCVMTITPQTGKNNVTYAQVGKDVLVIFETNNIHSHISGGFFRCGTSSTTSSTGTLTGWTLMQGNGGSITIGVH